MVENPGTRFYTKYHHSSPNLRGYNISSDKMLRFYKAIRPSPGFYVDEAPNSSPLTVELFAQVRSNGRILDNIRHVLGGSILLEGGFSFKKICRREDLAGWTANFTMRPRNITLRKGMLTSLWTDVSEMIAARNMDVMDNNGTSVSAADFLRTYGNQDEEPAPAAIRWALMLTEYGQLSLQLQGLPGAAATLNSKPAFKRLVKPSQLPCINITL
jgi:hypothetical protein